MAEPVICLVGPTASGKTELAVTLAKRFGAEIVGADASQVYRGMDIGTGKASPQELSGVVHHLLNVVNPDEPFDAGAYARLADQVLCDIEARGRRAILCGGTGLYLRALLSGLCEAPTVAPEHRERLAARIQAGELPALHAELCQVDPQAGARIGPRDTQRVERALGVFLTTGRPLSAWQAETAPLTPRTVVWLGLDVPPAVLLTRIERRTQAMFAGGLVEEVRRLLDAGYDPSLKSFGALGYRSVVSYLRGAISLEAAKHQTLLETRQYAKRQRTWFRAVPDIHWLPWPAPVSSVLPWVEARWP